MFTATTPAPTAPQPVAAAQLVSGDSRRVTSPVTEKAQLVDFPDFECESCRAAQPLVEELKKEFGDRIIFVNRCPPRPPALGPGCPGSGSRSVAGQTRTEVHQNVRNHPQWSEKQDSQAPLFRTFAQELKLDLNKHDASVADETTMDRSRKDVADGTALGLTGTPTACQLGAKLTPTTELTTEAEFRQGRRREVNAGIAGGRHRGRPSDRGP